MVEVIQFPTRAVRDRVAVEKTIREMLDQSGASPGMIEEVCSRMKDFFEVWTAAQLSLSYQLPDLPEELRAAIQNSIEKGLKQLSEQMIDYTNKLLFDRLKLEIELYNLLHEGPEKP